MTQQPNHPRPSQPPASSDVSSPPSRNQSFLSPANILCCIIALLVMALGAYLNITKQMPVFGIFFIGVGLSIFPQRIVNFLGALVSIATGAYWLWLNGQSGLLYGSLFIIFGAVVIADRLRKSA